MAKNTKHGKIEEILLCEPYKKLSNMLKSWRTDPFYQLMEKTHSEGKILGFIKGLRLSAELIYILRDIVSATNLEVDWGHLVDKNGNSCSPECDIIIHKPGYLRRWNGSEKPIMDFKFIKCSEAIAVISCKSFLKNIDIEYSKKFKKYELKNIFLFAECCETNQVKTLTKNALKAGYKGLWYLYTIEKKDSIISENEKIYLEFIKKIQTLSSGF